MPFDKSTTLRMRWSKKQGDLLTDYPTTKADARLLHNAFNYGAPSGYEHPFLKELERHGYDLTTLKFSIKKKGK